VRINRPACSGCGWLYFAAKGFSIMQILPFYFVFNDHLDGISFEVDPTPRMPGKNEFVADVGQMGYFLKIPDR
jgi:hypothetical protein